MHACVCVCVRACVRVLIQPVQNKWLKLIMLQIVYQLCLEISEDKTKGHYCIVMNYILCGWKIGMELNLAVG